jgi:L-malate glycosyltransferase
MIDLSCALQARGVDVIVAIPRPGSIEHLLRSNKIPYHMIRSYPWVRRISTTRNLALECSKAVWNAFAEKRIRNLMVKEHVDVLHINSSCTSLGASSASKLGIPRVWHLREYLEDDYGLRFLDDALASRLISSSEAVVAVSSDLRSAFQKRLRAGIRLVHNGIPLETVRPAPRSDDPSRPLEMLMVGILSPKKGHLDALRALAHVKKVQTRPIHLTIIGDGPGNYMLQLRDEVERLDLREDVHIAGYQSDLRPRFAKADMHLTCSNREAFGRVTVEAMSHGLLAIASNTGGSPEIIAHRNTGLLYESGDAISLAAQIGWAASHPDQACVIAQAGQASVALRFDIELVADEVMTIYASVLRRKTSSVSNSIPIADVPRVISN